MCKFAIILKQNPHLCSKDVTASKTCKHMSAPPSDICCHCSCLGSCTQSCQRGPRGCLVLGCQHVQSDMPGHASSARTFGRQPSSLRYFLQDVPAQDRQPPHLPGFEASMNEVVQVQLQAFLVCASYSSHSITGFISDAGLTPSPASYPMQICQHQANIRLALGLLQLQGGMPVLRISEVIGCHEFNQALTCRVCQR